MFLESQQAAASAAPGGSPNLIEDDSTPRGFDSTSSAGSASTLQSASPTSPRHALHDVATRLDFGNGTVDDDVDMAAPTTRELATQTEERRYYGKAMEKQRRTAEEEDYKDTRQKLKAQLDALPVPTDTDIRDADGLSWEKPSPQQKAFIPAVLQGISFTTLQQVANCGYLHVAPSSGTFSRTQDRLTPFVAWTASEVMKQNAQRVVNALKPGEKATINIDGSYQSQRNATNGSVTITSRIVDATTGPQGRDVVLCCYHGSRMTHAKAQKLDAAASHEAQQRALSEWTSVGRRQLLCFTSAKSMEIQLVYAATKWLIENTVLTADKIGQICHDKCSRTFAVMKEVIGTHLAQKHDRGHRRKHFAKSITTAGRRYCNGRMRGIGIAFSRWLRHAVIGGNYDPTAFVGMLECGRRHWKNDHTLCFLWSLHGAIKSDDSGNTDSCSDEEVDVPVLSTTRQGVTSNSDGLCAEVDAATPPDKSEDGQAVDKPSDPAPASGGSRDANLSAQSSQPTSDLGADKRKLTFQEYTEEPVPQSWYDPDDNLGLHGHVPTAPPFSFQWGHLESIDIKILTAMLERVASERSTFVSQSSTAALESMHGARYISVLPKGRTFSATYALRCDISILNHENLLWPLHLMEKLLPFDVGLSEAARSQWEHDAIMTHRRNDRRRREDARNAQAARRYKNKVYSQQLNKPAMQATTAGMSVDMEKQSTWTCDEVIDVTDAISLRAVEAGAGPTTDKPSSVSVKDITSAVDHITPKSVGAALLERLKKRPYIWTKFQVDGTGRVTNNPTGKRSIHCSLCGQEGHNRTACPRNRNRTAKRRAPPVRDDSDDDTAEISKKRRRRCGHCHESGHDKRNCVTLQRLGAEAVGDRATRPASRARSCRLCGAAGHDKRNCPGNGN